MRNSGLIEAAMDGERFEADSDFQLNQCASGVHGGFDRISQLPNEILFLILSYLPVRKAASTTVLSSRWLDLWKQIPNLKFNLESDRISQLPDSVLLFIFSFLTLREVVATSVLSSRWSDLWKHNPSLDFDADDIFEVSNQTHRAVNSVIQSHEALSLKQFRIFFRVDRSAKSTVTKWLEFIFSRQVESLELDFSVLNDSDMLVLEESLRETGITRWAPQTLIFLQSLKSLHLGGLKVCGEDIELFLRNCPLLEKLEIHCARLASDIRVCGATLMLKHLDILGCSGEKSVTISAPNLTSFRFTNSIGKLVFECVPKLVEADLRFSSSEFAVQHIAIISQLQILKLTLVLYKKLPTDMFSNFPNLKKLFLHFTINNNQSLLPVTALMWASPCLEEFILKITIFADPSAWMEDITNVERSPHQHLKVLEIQMYSQETDRLVELVSYLSDNCVALREVIIRRGDLDRHQEFEGDLEYLKQQLQGKVRSQIQLRVDKLLF